MKGSLRRKFQTAQEAFAPWLWVVGSLILEATTRHAMRTLTDSCLTVATTVREGVRRQENPSSFCEDTGRILRSCESVGEGLGIDGSSYTPGGGLIFREPMLDSAIAPGMRT